jgi:hypothetical protein
VDAFLVVLITLPVPIFISTYYVPLKVVVHNFFGISTYYGSTYYVPSNNATRYLPIKNKILQNSLYSIARRDGLTKPDLKFNPETKSSYDALLMPGQGLKFCQFVVRQCKYSSEFQTSYTSVYS